MELGKENQNDDLILQQILQLNWSGDEKEILDQAYLSRNRNLKTELWITDFSAKTQENYFENIIDITDLSTWLLDWQEKILKDSDNKKRSNFLTVTN